MPFTSLTDPSQLAKADEALEILWQRVRSETPEESQRSERTKLAYIVAGFAPLAIDQQDLIENALAVYRHSLRGAA